MASTRDLLRVLPRAAFTLSRPVIRASASSAQRSLLIRLSRPNTLSLAPPTSPLQTACQWRRAYSSTIESGSESRKSYTYEEMLDLVNRLSRDGNPHQEIIVDVREPAELQQTGRIPTAINVPINSHPDSFHIPEDEFRLRYGFDRPAPDRRLVIYCKAGVRARGAAALARDAGYHDVADYPGSWLDWERNDGPVHKD